MSPTPFFRVNNLDDLAERVRERAVDERTLARIVFALIAELRHLRAEHAALLALRRRRERVES